MMQLQLQVRARARVSMKNMRNGYDFHSTAEQRLRSAGRGLVCVRCRAFGASLISLTIPSLLTSGGNLQTHVRQRRALS
jgi:hypothetical protein